MKPLTHWNFLFIFLIAFTSCKDQKADTSKDSNKIKLEKLTDSPAYANAVLRLNEPSDTIPSGEEKVTFDFEVMNYNLGVQTESPNAKLLANSDKGQHIHFILNNEPYSAHYETNFEKEIPEGVHHFVAFLSRSYHESVKNENSVVVKKLIVGDDAKDTNDLDIDAPTLIYSRPKGTYSGTGTERVMLDFFVLNTTLSENGNKVRATINGEEFVITEWAPQIITGLPMGATNIQLELVDAQGNLIDGPFNKVTRSITLEK
jgi:hypothetical protein